MASQVVLILGSGPRVGAAVAKGFAAQGYKVAQAGRRFPQQPEKSPEGYTNFHLDLADPKSLAGLFAAVKKELGVPSVVVYNGFLATFHNPSDPLNYSLDTFATETTGNIVSVLAALQEAVKGFAELPATASKTFIYTGNATHLAPLTPALAVGVGKSAVHSLINELVLGYGESGNKFYYADERFPDGKLKGMQLDGDAHGVAYPEIAALKKQGPWDYTFVKGKGYVNFPPGTPVV